MLQPSEPTFFIALILKRMLDKYIRIILEITFGQSTCGEIWYEIGSLSYAIC